MKFRTLCFFVSLSLSFHLAAEMVRVAGVTGGQTLVVERRGAQVEVKLAGIAMIDDRAAHELMQWTLVSRWVMLEEQRDGGFYVYRSPDALFVNRELVTRGFARATQPAIEPHQHVVVTYLGTIRGLGVRTPLAYGTGSGTSSPAPASPSRPPRRRRPAAPNARR